MITDYLELFLIDKSTYCEPASMKYYEEDIYYFINYCNDRGITCISEIDKTVISSYIVNLRKKDITNVSIHTYYRALKVFMRWLYDNGYLEIDYTVKIKLPKKDPKIVEPLTIPEVNKINDYFFEDNYLGLRNYCIFHLMLDSGLRRSEVINLKQNDIKGNQLYIRNSKNNKSRVILCPEFLTKSISNYIGSIKQNKYVLYDRYGTSRITEDCIRKLFVNLKQIDGIERIHPHLCRHTFATSYMLYGGNMEMLRLILGHSDYSITQNYLHLANQQKLIQNDVYKIDDIFFNNRCT